MRAAWSGGSLTGKEAISDQSEPAAPAVPTLEPTALLLRQGYGGHGRRSPSTFRSGERER